MYVKYFLLFGARQKLLLLLFWYINGSNHDPISVVRTPDTHTEIIASMFHSQSTQYSAIVLIWFFSWKKMLITIKKKLFYYVGILEWLPRSEKNTTYSWRQWRIHAKSTETHFFFFLRSHQPTRYYKNGFALNMFSEIKKLKLIKWINGLKKLEVLYVFTVKRQRKFQFDT